MTYYLSRFILPAAYDILPAKMDTIEASAMLLTIALQESKALHRKQVKGPARGFWQFEQAGIKGVQNHKSSKAVLRTSLVQLCYPADLSAVAAHAAIEHNDILACIFARLLLWTEPQELPTRDLPWKGWDQYIVTWRPGKPHLETWLTNWDRAWALANKWL